MRPAEPNARVIFGMFVFDSRTVDACMLLVRLQETAECAARRVWEYERRSVRRRCGAARAHR